MKYRIIEILRTYIKKKFPRNKWENLNHRKMEKAIRLGIAFSYDPITRLAAYCLPEPLFFRIKSRTCSSSSSPMT